MPETKKDLRIYKVSELTGEIKFILEDALDELWVEGEISNFKIYPSGHSYFSLKDEMSTLKCVMFKNSGARINFKIEDGMRVLCLGKIGLYEKQGQYQLYVSKIEVQGKGALYLAFEELKKKLFKEGLFDESRKRPIPYLPLKVGVVTSSAGAAIHDILKVAKRRFANIEILLYPVRVQGDGAKEDIKEAIENLNEYNEFILKTGSDEHTIDVLIVGRGGGSLEDLWAFNEEIVARSIAGSKIPVISAVGHEIDFTIADFAADYRAATPSHAAEIVIPEKKELIARLETNKTRLGVIAKAAIDERLSRVNALSRSYVLKDPTGAILQFEQRLDDIFKKMYICLYKGPIERLPGKLDELSRRSYVKISHSMDLAGERLASVSGKLSSLNPMSILDRGYSITFKGGNILKSSKELSKGDELVTRFAEGKVVSKVEEAE